MNYKCDYCGYEFENPTTVYGKVDDIVKMCPSCGSENYLEIEDE